MDRLDVELERGIPFLKAELRRLGAPGTTKLEFKRSGERAVEEIGI